MAKQEKVPGSAYTVHQLSSVAVAQTPTRDEVAVGTAVVLLAKCRFYLHKSLRGLKLRLVHLAVGDTAAKIAL